ncbi:MAG: NDP-sugar synthase [Ignavibacteriae bacterium]|nr:NDP-sugar synthase [Ignavibacteriota bacterium]
MKAGIIAAGEGSRLRSEGITLHKPLVPVNGVPLIERLITSFIRGGITEIVCIVNEYSLVVKQFVEGKQFNIPITFIVKTTTSSMHSLFALAPHLQTRQFLLTTIDSIFSEDEFLKFLNHAERNQTFDAILAVTNFIDDEKPLYVEVDDRMCINSFSKSEQTPWVTGGLYVFQPRIFNEMDAVVKQGIERLRNFLRYLLNKGYSLEAFPFSKIVDVDHLRDIQNAEEFLRAS